MDADFVYCFFCRNLAVFIQHGALWFGKLFCVIFAIEPKPERKIVVYEFY